MPDHAVDAIAARPKRLEDRAFLQDVAHVALQRPIVAIHLSSQHRRNAGDRRRKRTCVIREEHGAGQAAVEQWPLLGQNFAEHIRLKPIEHDVDDVPRSGQLEHRLGRPLPSSRCRGICADDRRDERCRLQGDEHTAGERRDTNDVFRRSDSQAPGRQSTARSRMDCATTRWTSRSAAPVNAP